MRREINLYPAYDHFRGTDRRYGAHNAVMTFTVIGSSALTLCCETGWYLRSTTSRPGWTPYKIELPNLIEFYYCSSAPLSYGHVPSTKPCPWLGCRCYSNSSFRSGEDWREPLVAGGTEWLWPKLEELYRHVFERGPMPDLTPRYVPHPDERKSS